MIGAILGIISAILNIVELKERRKYLDRKLELEKAWYNEYNKPLSQRNNAALDTIEFEIIALLKAVQNDLELLKK